MADLHFPRGSQMTLRPGCHALTSLNLSLHTVSSPWNSLISLTAPHPIGPLGFLNHHVPPSRMKLPGLSVIYLIPTHPSNLILLIFSQKQSFAYPSKTNRTHSHSSLRSSFVAHKVLWVTRQCLPLCESGETACFVLLCLLRAPGLIHRCSFYNTCCKIMCTALHI